MSTQYVEIVFIQGDETDEFFKLMESDRPTWGLVYDNDALIEYGAQWDYADDYPDKLTREQVLASLGLGYAMYESEYGLIAWNWNHAWVAYYRKETSE